MHYLVRLRIIVGYNDGLHLPPRYFLMEQKFNNTDIAKIRTKFELPW